MGFPLRYRKSIAKLTGSTIVTTVSRAIGMVIVTTIVGAVAGTAVQATAPLAAGKIAPLAVGKIAPLAVGKTSSLAVGKIAPLAVGKTSSLAAGQTVPLAAGHRTPTIVAQSLSWEALFKLLAPQRRSGASRDAGPCILSMSPLPLPTVPNRTLTGNPSLIWRGGATAVGLRRSGEDRPFWKQSLSRQPGNIKRIQYSGPALEADVDYQWVVYGTPEKAYADFQVMNEVDRDLITQQLNDLTGKDEATLQKRLAVYSSANLTSDALAEVFAQRNPSSELKRSIQSLPDWCPKPPSVTPVH
jgi:hypothetical protein